MFVPETVTESPAVVSAASTKPSAILHFSTYRRFPWVSVKRDGTAIGYALVDFRMRLGTFVH